MLSQAGADIMMSQHGCRETNFGAGTRLGNKDHLVKWPRPQRPKRMDAETYNGLPDYLQVREIEVDGRVLVTTLQDAKAVSPQEIDALYAMRWNIEVDFRTLKATMAMDVLSCKSQAMIDKEIAVYLLAYNLVRWAMAKAALLSEILPRALSFIGAKLALGILEEHLRHHGAKRAGRMIGIARAAIANQPALCFSLRALPRAQTQTRFKGEKPSNPPGQFYVIIPGLVSVIIDKVDPSTGRIPICQPACASPLPEKATDSRISPFKSETSKKWLIASTNQCVVNFG